MRIYRPPSARSYKVIDNTDERDLQQLVEDWLKREQEGERFPVSFDEAWPIAGYADKGKGKRRLTSKSSLLVENEDYRIEKGVFTQTGKSGLSGRSRDSILLTCDAFKHFCLIAQTEQGRQIRQYFIEAEKKWRMVQEQHPDIALEVELQKIKLEMVKAETEKEKAIAQAQQAIASAKQADLNLVHFRHTITTTCPEPVQQKILGYQTVTQIERVQTVIDRQTGEESEGVGITYVAKALGFKNTKAAWQWLESVGYGKESGRWRHELAAIHTPKLSRDDLQHLKDIFPESGRQMFFGE